MGCGRASILQHENFVKPCGYRKLDNQLAELSGDKLLQGRNRLEGVAQGVLVPRRQDARVDVGVERLAPFCLGYL